MNLLEPGLAFIEGIALIASPCVLPVLPLVLSTATDGGKGRPFGIIAGFILSFSVLALASRSLIEALGIDITLIKNLSLILLFLLGLVLILPSLSAVFSRMTQKFAFWGQRATSRAEGGFFSGLGIGSLIGLIWTPCAGPILAAVLVQIIRQENDVDGMVILLAFALGAGLPMLAMALAGRKIMARFGLFTKHAEMVRRVFGALIILSVLYIAFGTTAQAYLNRTAPESAMMQHSSMAGPSMMMAAATTAPSMIKNGLVQPYAAPEFAGLKEWMNSAPLTMAELKGKVVLIDFWTYSCINCIRTLPHVTAWDRKYRDQGLVIIGIHAPEFEFEKDTDNVRKAVKKYGIDYPVAQDNELRTWENFKNRYWPAHYLINQQGEIVYTHFGEGKYDVTENNIRHLLGLTDKVEGSNSPLPYATHQTPETYLGYGRAARYVGGGVMRDTASAYTYPDSIPEHSWALNGTWSVGEEKSTTGAPDASLRLNFKAKKVFLVLGSATGEPVQADITLNGKDLGDDSGKDIQDSMLTVTDHRLYELIDLKDAQGGVIEIKAQSPGLEAYAFTFGQ